MSSSAAFDLVAGFFRVTSSTLSAKTKSVLLQMAGAGDEVVPDQIAYGGLGLLGRPRAEDGDQHVDVMGLRAGDRVVPIAYRDARIDKAFPNGIAAGTIALAGYGGGSYSLLDTTGESGDQKATVHVIYAPYQFSGGVPAKAHVITIDTTPGNESLGLVHAEGHAVLLTPQKKVILKNAAGDAYVEVGDDGNVLNGNTVINGGATIGSPTGALPAAKATPLMTYITALEGLLTTIAGATVPATSAAVTAFQSATSAVKAAIPATNTSVF